MPAALSPQPAEDSDEYRALAARVGRVHLRQRLGIERDKQANVFGQGLALLHIDKWLSFDAVIRFAIRLSGLSRVGQRNALDLQLRDNEIVIPGLPASFDGFTLLHLSDLHLDLSDMLGSTLIQRLQGVEYDIAVMTGDFRARTFGPIAPALDDLERVCAGLVGPVYAVLGNHDCLGMVPPMEAMGIRFLLNESLALERHGESIHLAGIDDPHYFRTDNMEKAAQHIPEDAVSILLAHTPEVYRHAAHAGFSVMLCGHTHGGQICLPGGAPILTNARCPRRLCRGAWRHGPLAGYTSAGAGAAMVLARFNCPPEITLHRLRSASLYNGTARSESPELTER